jgi:hypothetical protein
MLYPEELKFRIDDDGEVLLCLGSVSIEVCEEVSDFPQFIRELTKQLEKINHEMQESYGED